MLGISRITYLDIGANLPIDFNNTYYFYRRGYRGVLVEPNVTLCEQLRAVRPADTTLAAGIEVTAAKEADYYIMTCAEFNTFSKVEVDHQAEATKGKIAVKEVIKMPLLNINDVMEEHFFKGAPTFLSVDTEGLDLAILKCIDYTRFRPKIICAETLVSSTTRTLPEIPEFMVSRGYVVAAARWSTPSSSTRRSSDPEEVVGGCGRDGAGKTTTVLRMAIDWASVLGEASIQHGGSVTLPGRGVFTAPPARSAAARAVIAATPAWPCFRVTRRAGHARLGPAVPASRSSSRNRS